VAERRPIHSLPDRRDGILLGLANIRGELVTCLSVGHLLQIDAMPSLESIRANYRRLLVLNSEAGKVAFPVDEVQGPERFHPHELKNPPSISARANSGHAQALLDWRQRAVGLLDAERLVSSLSHWLA